MVKEYEKPIEIFPIGSFFKLRFFASSFFYNIAVGIVYVSGWRCTYRFLFDYITKL